jgi:hypothetical protein
VIITTNSSIAEKGRSTFLLKGMSKNKRKRSEIEEVKDEESKLNVDKQQYLKRVKQMREEFNTMKGEILVDRQAKSILENLQRQGVVDERGNATKGR